MSQTPPQEPDGSPTDPRWAPPPPDAPPTAPPTSPQLGEPPSAAEWGASGSSSGPGGTAPPPPASPPSADSGAPEGKSNLLLFGAIGAAAVVVLGLGAFFLLQDDDSDDDGEDVAAGLDDAAADPGDEGDDPTAEDPGPGDVECAEPGAPADLRDEYVAAFLSHFDSNDCWLYDNDIQAMECWAGSVADVVGLDRLEGAMTPEELAATPGWEPADFDVFVDVEVARDMVERMDGCMDLGMLLNRMWSVQFGGQEQADCITEAMDGELIRRAYTGMLLNNDMAAVDDTLEDELATVVGNC